MTLAHDDEQKIPAHSLILSVDSRTVKTEEKKAEEDNTNEKEENVNKIQVKFSLNKLKNLEVAKTNASRPIKIDRLTINDTNIRYEMNAGQYLHIKEDLLKFKRTQTETSENGEVTIKVEKPSVVEDTDKNNVESQIKMSVINNKTKENTSVVIKMYHTNQYIHL